MNELELHPYDGLTEATLREKACSKWGRYPADTLPLFVADMDFPVATSIKDAIREHLEGDNFGYPPAGGLPGLREALRDRLASRFGWTVDTDAIEPLSGIINGLQLGTLLTSGPGDDIVVNSPIYPPFLATIEETGRRVLHNPLEEGPDGFTLDTDALDAAITPRTRMLMFCNPHNPTGRVFTRAELERLAEVVLRHRLWVVSDELHSDLVFAPHEHVPFASLSPEVAERTLTLLGPTKTFTIAGLRIGFAVAQDPRLMADLRALAGHHHVPNTLAQVAAIAAYRHGDAWLEDTLAYLRDNRDVVQEFLRERIPGVTMHAPQGTYLAWLDFRALELGSEPYDWLLEHAKVALNPGPTYGPNGSGFARLNFATSRGILTAALERIERAVGAR